MPNAAPPSATMKLVESVALAVTVPSAPQGGTVPLTSLPMPTTGYFVGGATASLIYASLDDVNWPEVNLFVESAHTSYVGWWVDGSTGKVYFDQVNWYQNKWTALSIARVRGELAVWWIDQQMEISVRY